MTKLKQAIIAWMAIYPGVTLVMLLGGQWLNTLALPIRTLILTLILVPYMFFVGIPLLSRVFKKWLKF